jgi:uncharacterized protein (UPF0333 family)
MESLAGCREIRFGSMTLTRALSSVLIVVLFAVAGIFVITKYSDAQEQATCPVRTELAADGTNCLSPAVNDNVVTTTSCAQGVLSNNGKTCILARFNGAPASATAEPLQAPIPTFTG